MTDKFRDELCDSCAHLKYVTDGVTCDINAPRWDALIVPIYAGDKYGGCDEYKKVG